MKITKIEIQISGDSINVNTPDAKCTIHSQGVLVRLMSILWSVLFFSIQTNLACLNVISSSFQKEKR